MMACIWFSTAVGVSDRLAVLRVLSKVRAGSQFVNVMLFPGEHETEFACKMEHLFVLS